MKALSTTILIVVTAVVILVAALVVLTIFGGGIGTVSSLTNFKNNCVTQCQMTCKLGSLPPTWGIKQKISGGGEQSCDDVVDEGTECGCTGGTSGTSGTSGVKDCSQYNNNAGPCAANGCYFCSKSGANYLKCLSSPC